MGDPGERRLFFGRLFNLIRRNNYHINIPVHMHYKQEDGPKIREATTVAMPSSDSHYKVPDCLYRRPYQLPFMPPCMKSRPCVLDGRWLILWSLVVPRSLQFGSTKEFQSPDGTDDAMNAVDYRHAQEAGQTCL